MSYAWAPRVLSLELRKFLTYRFDFFAQLFGGVAIQMATAYFLWSAVFAQNQTNEVGGYAFGPLMFYYLLIPFFESMTINQQNAASIVSDEIYDGGLTRYLIYPLPVLFYKYVATFSNFVIGVVQVILVVAIVHFTIGIPTEVVVSPSSVAMALVSTLVGSYLYFCMVCAIEMCAFWADNVWSLKVMLRFVISLLGGALLPLSMYPEWAVKVLEVLPFQYLFYVPIRALMGQVPFEMWIKSIFVGALWSILLTGTLRTVWRRGLLQYTGVGV